MHDILKKLGLAETNPGTWLGSTALEDESAPLIESINPTTGAMGTIVWTGDQPIAFDGRPASADIPLTAPSITGNRVMVAQWKVTIGTETVVPKLVVLRF